MHAYIGRYSDKENMFLLCACAAMHQVCEIGAPLTGGKTTRDCGQPPRSFETDGDKGWVSVKRTIVREFRHCPRLGLKCQMQDQSATDPSR